MEVGAAGRSDLRRGDDAMTTPGPSRRTGPLTGATSLLTTGSWRRAAAESTSAAHRADGQPTDAGPFLALAVGRLQARRGVSGQQAEELLRQTAAQQGLTVRDTARAVVLLGDLPADPV
jgi:hypothetical protein